MMIYDLNPVANLISKKFSTKRRVFIVVSSFLSVMFYYLFICAIKKLFIFHIKNYLLKQLSSIRSLILFCLTIWKKRISTTLQFGNVAIISEAYRRLFNFGAETLQRDFDLEHAFD